MQLPIRSRWPTKLPRSAGFFCQRQRYDSGVRLPKMGIPSRGNHSQTAFAKGLIMETAGAQGQVIRCLPPLTVSEEILEQGANPPRIYYPTKLCKRQLLKN